MTGRYILTILMLVYSITYAQPAYVFHEKGIEKYNKGDYQGALKDFETALQKDKNDFESHYDHGRTLEALGKHDLALTDYTNSIKANPDFAKAYFNRASLQMKKNDADGAIKDLSKVISLNPNYAPAYVSRGIAYHSKKQDDQALTDLNKASDLKSKDPELYVHRATILASKGKNKEAITDLTSAINATPDKHELFAKRGNVYFNQNDYKNAIPDLSKAIELKGGTEDVFRMRAEAYFKTGNYAGSIADYNQLIDVKKVKDPEYYLNRATAHRLKGDSPNALKDLTKYLGIKRDDPIALTERGIIYSTQGKSKYPLAATDFKKALSIKKELAEPYLYLGKMDFETGKYEPAIENLNGYLKMKEDPEGYYLRSKAHYKLDHKKEMCTDLSKASQLGHKEAKKDLSVMCPNY